MSLAVGTRLGPYEIVGSLGAGGMGEVYRARDTRLDRTVAIKILGPKFSNTADLKQRFEREARAISKLSHPHICGLFDVGSQDGTEFLVMEFLEGETLADRLKKGALSTDLVLRYGIQIADALNKAHKQGIIHRDLKPGNIMLIKSGVKLLDFGLAKLQSTVPSTNFAELSALATEAREITTEGTILGTVQYMAPEQLEGKEADARSDIFAFGSVLYEMATGQKAFEGKSRASLISAILKDEPPPIAKIQPFAPAVLDRVVKTCLAKDPDERWQNVHDVMKELMWIADGTSTPAAGVASSKWKRERIFWVLSIFALMIALLAALRYPRLAPVVAGPMRYSIVLPDKSALRDVVYSPDGSKIVFVARDSSGKTLLWLRPIDSLSANALLNTENPSFPFWSPDSRFIGFFADGKLKKINAEGGPPQTLCDAPIPRGGSWSREGIIIFNPTVNGAIYRVPDSGGSPVQLTQINLQRGEDNHRWPWFLPDGKHFLYLAASFSGQKQANAIYVSSLDSKEDKLLVKVDSSMAYTAGYILFDRDGNLLAQPFDANKREISGEPLVLAEDIQRFAQTYQALFSVSQKGDLLYQKRSASGLSQLVWIDRRGTEISKLGVPANQANPRISPDGNRVAVDVIDPQIGNDDVWIYPAAGGIPTRFTSDPSLENQPIWSPDSQQIIFMSLRKAHPDLYRKSSSGKGNAEVVVQAATNKSPTDWSQDGHFILYRSNDTSKISNLELWVLPIEGDRKPFPFIQTTFGASQGQFSPDGKWVAYTSNETGKWEVYVTSFPTPGANWKISTAGGSEPRWRRDGKELFYVAPDAQLMSVNVKVGTTFEAEEAKPLFQIRTRQHISSSDMFSYDVSSDGKRFLVNKDLGELTAPPVTVVLNWTAEHPK